jgi:hypothetical protein
VITQTNRLANREKMLQLVECYDSKSMTSMMTRNMMQKLFEGLFSGSYNLERRVKIEVDTEIEICCTVERL